MRVWKIGAAIVLAAGLAACGGNSTPVGVTVFPTGTATSPIPVIVNNEPGLPPGQQQFTSTVTGTSTSTVNWLVCLPPPSLTVAHPIPLNCGQLTGFGTISITGLYVAPPTPPSPNIFVVAAQSTVNQNIYGISFVEVGSGIRVSIAPTSATIAPGESVLFTPTVTGTTNTAVTWSVTGDNTTVVGGNSTIGFICPNPAAPQPCPAGTYIAPLTSPGNVTITATSAADTSQSATATVTVSASASQATISSIMPAVAQEGSVQQDIYLNGTNFSSNSKVLANGVAVPTIFLSAALLRATIPAAQLVSPAACAPQTVSPQIPILVQSQNGDLSLPQNLTINPSRPALVASSPDSTVASAANVGITLTGGYFSPCTSAFFNAQPETVSAGGSTRVLQLTISDTDFGPPGLYPIVVRNTDVVAPNPPISAVNLSIEPTSFPTAPSTSIGVGASPSAIAIDPVLDEAVVANTGAGTVSIINLATNAVVPVTVGPNPTGVAIDDQLAHHLAVVVNNGSGSGGNSVTAIDLTTLATSTLDFPDTAVPPNTVALPFSIGINSSTHRAIVTQQSTNLATILDLSTGTPVIVQQIGGGLSSYSTGASPSVAIDPRLNWAIVTPGGGGSVSIVDLGRGPGTTPGDPVGRLPVVIGSLSVATSTQGIGINTQTHQALLTDVNGASVSDPTGGRLTTYSLLDNTVASIPILQNGNPFSEAGFVAAAVNPLSNVGIAVNALAGTASVVDMENSNVLQTVLGLSSPQAVAIDAVTNQAFIVNQGSNSVSVVSLGTAGQFRSLQIVESSPAIAFVTNPTSAVTLTINGIGFSGAPQVVVDGTALPAGDVTVVSNRQILATIPASMLTNARNFIVYVQSGGQWSNTTELALIQPVPVGNSPVGVAIDQDLDQAVVTNNADNTVSILNLLTGAPILSGSTVSVGSNPEGVAVIARLGLAVVANNGSNSATVVDEAGVGGVFTPPTTLPLCGSCFAPAGVGINSDTATAGIANTDPGSATTQGSGSVGFLLLPATGTSGTLGLTLTVDQFPVAVAMAPVLLSPPIPGVITTLNYAAVATDSSASSVDVVNVSSASIVSRVSPFQLPTGVVFDPVNQDFLVADSVINNVVVIDPNTFIPVSFRVGIGPTSLDYNYQTSTLVTNNAVSNTLSIVGYVCPPSAGGPPSCAGPRVREVVGVGGLLQPSSVVVGPNSIAIDLKMNLGVLVDQSNNRVLLVPLPH
ncbi:MAG TPA: YncE family protein [Candidatus Acidoferrales bacterium]|nr:YncE family protein [Candidatus Acidoferrales bacterium]